MNIQKDWLGSLKDILEDIGGSNEEEEKPAFLSRLVALKGFETLI